MLTLDHAQPIAERVNLSAGTHRLAGDTDVLTAWDTHVADAMCHLLSGFLIVEDLGRESSRTLFRPAPVLDVISQNISTALERLNDCSFEIWLLPQARTPASVRLRGFCRRLRLGRDLTVHCRVNAGPSEEIAAGTVTERPSGVQGSSTWSGHWSTKRACVSVEPEWEDSLAAALLHLVGAYRAMELLSSSTFPAAAPRAFAVSCDCLCTALATLDSCLSGYDD
jgi:hypothetical protein